MTLVYRESQSSESPVLLDTTSSKTTVYIRKDVKETKQTFGEGDNAVESTVYTYKEAKLTKTEYEDYKLELQMSNTIDLEGCTLDQLKAYWKEKINETCQNVIDAGIDVETTKGTEHFSLELTDQINIGNTYNNLVAGIITSASYHADGKLCRTFTKEEFLKVAIAALEFKTYNTTLCNHIHTWIDRCESKTEVEAIEYTSELPEDLADSLAAIVASTASSYTTVSE